MKDSPRPLIPLLAALLPAPGWPVFPALAILCLVPTAYFWVALILQEGFGNPVLFEPVFVALDRTLPGKLVQMFLLLALPAVAAALAAIDVARRWLRGEKIAWLDPVLMSFSAVSVAAILFHALTDR